MHCRTCVASPRLSRSNAAITPPRGSASIGGGAAEDVEGTAAVAAAEGGEEVSEEADEVDEGEGVSRRRVRGRVSRAGRRAVRRLDTAMREGGRAASPRWE
jgi:hypothetical protein